MGMQGIALALESASFASKTVVLLSAVRVLLLHVAVKSAVLRGNAQDVVFLSIVHLPHLVFIKALVALCNYALTIASGRGYFLFALVDI